MGRSFGKGNYPTVWGASGGVRTNQRERLFFVAAAGLCFSLFLILIFVLNFRSDAKANVATRVEETIPNANPGTVTLLTPERAVKPGEPLASVRFKELYWPRNQVPEGAIRDVAEVQGMFAKVALSPQVPLQRAHLTKESSQIILPVTPGNRAVSIEVNDTSGIEGHALPGTRVDVTLTYYNEGQLTSRIIVQNARIISAGGDTTSITEMNKVTSAARHSARTITLDVSIRDALEIQTSRQLGRLSLFMRNPDDNSGVQVDSVNRQDIENGGKKDLSLSKKKPGCKMGRMKSNGREYVVDCDGSLSEVSNQAEP